MRTFIRRATVVAGLSFCSVPVALGLPGLAAAASGGASLTTAAAPSPASAAPGSGAASLETQPVDLTRPQTKSVQRRVHVRPDGALGAGTRKAIKRYQRVRKLALTGRPNIETLRTMGLRIADKIEAKLLAQQAQAASVPLLAPPAPPIAADAAIAAVRTAIGTPYRSGGITRKGFDCSGLTVWAYAQAGIKLPRTSFEQYKVGTAVAKADIQPGDLVFFNSAGPGASHVGIATSATTLISATTRGVMEHQLGDAYWGARYVGARRLADPA